MNMSNTLASAKVLGRLKGDRLLDIDGMERFAEKIGQAYKATTFHLINNVAHL